ncbi:MAG: VOC family protein [Actinomycetota bacterium]
MDLKPSTQPSEVVGMIRLRQVAFAARDLPKAEHELVEALDLELCYRDPGVAVFGLENALFAVGDQFLEIVAPTEEGTTAGRLLAKRGADTGYMAIFQADDLAPVESRVADEGVRIVFEAETKGIRGIHLHPKDVPGAIVSVDEADEPASWPWAGHEWHRHVRTDRVTAIRGLTVVVPDPDTTARRWATVLGIDADGPSVSVDDATVEFRSTGGDDGGDGITELVLASPRADLVGTTSELLGVTLRFVAP